MQKEVWYYEKWIGRHASFTPRWSVKLDQQSRQQGLKAYSPNSYTVKEGHESPSLGISYTCVTTFLLVCYFSPQTTVGSKPFQGFLNTGGPPLTRKSLTRFPLSRFLAYVCVSGVTLVGDHSTVPPTRFSCNTVYSMSQNACKAGTLCHSLFHIPTKLRNFKEVWYVAQTPFVNSFRLLETRHFGITYCYFL